MKLKLNVTERNIKNGIRGDAYSCAIAGALTDLGYRHPCVLPEESKASAWIDVEGEAQRFVFQLPRRATRFARAFDSKKEVKPSRFVLDGLRD